jgi:hypothetical protein
LQNSSVHGSTVRPAHGSPLTEYQYVTPFTLSLSKGDEVFCNCLE